MKTYQVMKTYSVDELRAMVNYQPNDKRGRPARPTPYAYISKCKSRNSFILTVKFPNITKRIYIGSYRNKSAAEVAKRILNAEFSTLTE